MEEYKQYLCGLINRKCYTVEDINNFVKDNECCTCTTNENGLHSYYTGLYYHPSIVYKRGNHTLMFWLFDGEIKDCIHPFYISINARQLMDITYYSSERIETNQYISISYFNGMCGSRRYNTYNCNEILHSSNYRTDEDFEPIDQDEHLFTSEFYPFCDEIYKYKFAD